jgi:hypothetical protein
MYLEQNMCWICNIKDKNLADDLVKKLNLENVYGVQISARKELQDPEYCKDYRIGKCTHQSCHFDHVTCTSPDNRCRRDCPLGHTKGVKDKSIIIPFDGE